MDLIQAECHSIVPDAPAVAAVFLHGYAMDGSELAPLAAAMRAPAALYFPRAPLKAGSTGRCWWPIDEERRSAAIARGPRDLCDEYPAHRPAARAHLIRIIEAVGRRHSGVPILLAGFSQGGMLAVDTLLHEAPQLSALALMSTSRIAVEEWKPRLDLLRGLPVLISHGRADADLSIQAGENLRDLLRAAKAHVNWLPFEGGHEIPFTVWRQIKRMIGELARRPAAH